MRIREFFVGGALALGGCTTTVPEVPWCAAEPTRPDARAASRVSPESERLDWARSCTDTFGRYAARNGMRVVVTYTPPVAAGLDDAVRSASLRDVIDRAPVPREVFDLRIRGRRDGKTLAGEDGLLVIELAER